jgi:beta-lactamase regulating signal transducer with metallopeptidase domain
LLEIGSSNAAVAGLMAIVVALVGLVCRRPALLHALWLLVLLKLITPPLFQVSPPSWGVERGAWGVQMEDPPVPEGVLELSEEWFVEDEDPGDQPEEPVAEAAPPSSSGPTPHEPRPTLDEWLDRLGAVWLTGSLVWFLLAGVRVLRFHRSLRLATPAPESVQRRCHDLAARLGVRHCPTVYVWRARVAPLLWWLGGRAWLVLPAGLYENLEPRAVDTLLLHELAHFRRRDHWVRALEFFVLGLYWWHPAVWYAQRELREAEEQCCDAWVVSVLPAVARIYATALVTTLDFLAGAAPIPLAASGMGPVSDLKRRLTMIVRGATPPRLSLATSLGVAVLGLLLSFVPAWAQPAPKEDAKKSAASELERARETLEAQLRALRADVVLQDRSDVKALEADLVRKQKELDEARARLEQARRSVGDRARADVVRSARAVVAGTAPKGVTIRIEISGLEGKPEELKALIARLEKELPGKDHKVVIVPATVLNRPGALYRTVPPTPAPPPAPGTVAPPAHVVPGAGFPSVAPPALPRKPVVVPPVGLHIEREGAKTPPGKVESRTEELEKKLDNVLKELLELRRELKGRPAGRR